MGGEGAQGGGRCEGGGVVVLAGQRMGREYKEVGEWGEHWELGECGCGSCNCAEGGH